MKREMIKKIFVVFLVAVLSLNAYAAVISDNNGPAFVTKREFEDLKKGFVNQVDNYNDSLNGKIDGAIASYLAGVNLVKPQIENVLNSSWKEVSSINGVLNNTFKVPNVNLQFMLGTIYSSNADAAESSVWNNMDHAAYWDAVSHWSRLVYTENWGGIATGSAKNCYRNLVTCTGPNPNNVGDIIWAGHALRYKEIWNISRMIPLNQHWSWMDQPYVSDFSIEMKNFSTLVEQGYITNWDSIKTSVWPIQYIYKYLESGTTWREQVKTFATTDVYDNHAIAVELIPDENKDSKTKIYEHIINYKGNAEWIVSNPDWTYLLNKCAESSIKSSDLKAAATLTQDGRWFGSAHHTNPHQLRMAELTITQSIADDEVIPSVGLFRDKVRADSIYQDNVKKDIEVTDKLKVKKEKPKLNQGFQLLAAKEDDKISWEPTFKYTHVHNTDTTYVDNNHEVNIYFSSGPFTDDITPTKLIKVKVDGGSTLKDFATTTDRKCKVEFDMPENGMVYVKWVPKEDNTTYFNSDWIVTLDLEKCNTYIYTRE